MLINRFQFVFFICKCVIKYHAIQYIRVLWGEKIGYEDGLRRTGCYGKRRRKNSCCNGFFAGIFAGRRNMTVILTFDPQFTERTVQITHNVFPQMFPRRTITTARPITSQHKRNHSSDERFSSLNTKLVPAVNFDCKKCLKLLRFLEN